MSIATRSKSVGGSTRLILGVMAAALVSLTLALSGCNGDNDDGGNPSGPDYKVTFNVNGGIGAAPAAQTVKTGSSITLPAQGDLTRSGYTFGGWNTNSSGTGTNYDEGSSYTPAKNITLYAKWAASYIVTFNVGSGNVNPTSATVGIDGKLASLPTPTRNGYTFDGWYTASSGGTEVTTSTTFTANTTIYARWTADPVTPPAEYTLNISLNPVSGGSVERKPPNKTAYKAGDTVSVTATAYAGYRFVSWAGALTSTNNPITITMSNANLELTANFEQTAVPPATPATITFDAQSGTVSPASAVTSADGKLASLPTPTRSGYTFDGWFTVATGGTAVTTSTVFGADATIYARWTTVTPPSGNTFTDSRDGTTYKKVTIGSQTWMAENLNYETPSGSTCYGNSPGNCTQYGRLYNWASAMQGAVSSTANPSEVRGVCPVGWHIPSVAEWDQLFRFVDGTTGTASPYDSPNAGWHLKATSGWNNNGSGGDMVGFAALPGGYGTSTDYFGQVGTHGYWWSATQYNATYAYDWFLRHDLTSTVWEGSDWGSKTYLFSVRCVAD